MSQICPTHPNPSQNNPQHNTTHNPLQSFSMADYQNVDKQHAVQFAPILTAGNEDKVHHILVYECDGMTEEESSYEGPCWNGDAPQKVQSCNFGTVVSSWAVGGGPTLFPDIAGMPFGSGQATPGHYLMEVSERSERAFLKTRNIYIYIIYIYIRAIRAKHKTNSPKSFDSLASLQLH